MFKLSLRIMSKLFNQQFAVFDPEQVADLHERVVQLAEQLLHRLFKHGKEEVLFGLAANGQDEVLVRVVSYHQESLSVGDSYELLEFYVFFLALVELRVKFVKQQVFYVKLLPLVKCLEEHGSLVLEELARFLSVDLQTSSGCLR